MGGSASKKYDEDSVSRRMTAGSSYGRGGGSSDAFSANSSSAGAPSRRRQNLDFQERLAILTKFNGSLAATKTPHDYADAPNVGKVVEEAMKAQTLMERGTVAVMADHFRWLDQEYALVRQGESAVLYLPCPVLVPITVMSYEVVLGMHEKWKGATAASSLRRVKDISPGCDEAIKADKVLSEGLEVFRLYHSTGLLYLSTPLNSPKPTPPHVLFSRVMALIPEIHSHIDIMGQKAIDKVNLAAEQVERAIFEEIGEIHKTFKRANVDTRTMAVGADKGGDALVYTAPCKHQGLSKKFTDCFLVIEFDTLLVYFNKDGYFNNRTPEKIMSLREVILRADIRERCLTVRTALHHHKLEFETIELLGECAKAIGEASGGHDNAVDIAGLIKRSQQLNEKERTMQKEQRLMRELGSPKQS